jgi:ADP-ribose pyrophosphatase YjhB (NUDIX family)
MEKETIKVPVVAGAILEKDYRYLLIQERQPAAYGLWNFPAGRVDVGETLEEAAEREAKEESGYTVKIIGKVGIFQNKAEDAVKHAYAVKITDGELKFPEDEIMDAKWFSFEEIESMRDKLRGSWILEALIKYEENFKNFA